MKKTLILLSLFLFSCASQPDEIKATYIPSATFINLNCEQIDVAIRQKSSRLQVLYQMLSDKKKSDQTKAAVGAVLFFPALFLLGGDDSPEAREYSTLRGELEALKDVKVVNKCNTKKDTVIADSSNVSEVSKDVASPIIKIQEDIVIDSRDYEIKGFADDESEFFIELDGVQITTRDNLFTLKGSVPVGRSKLQLLAFDKWGNETMKEIHIERRMQKFEIMDSLNPSVLDTPTSKNSIALIIGVENYKNFSSANYANRDAQIFIDFAKFAFGIEESKIKYLSDDSANLASKYEISDWFKKNVHNETEVYVFFSGHGIATEEGKELFLLINDSLSSHIKDTAFNRNEIFNDIAQYNPKSVTAFLDTCYSGAGRADGEMLLAMAKGLVVVDEEQQKLPDNFTLFTAASAQESAWSLPEAQHGTFSYFLMKGMEGNADLNGDKKLTNGELQEYLLDNVSRYAQQQQTPQMIGDPDQVLVRF